MYLRGIFKVCLKFGRTRREFGYVDSDFVVDLEKEGPLYVTSSYARARASYKINIILYLKKQVIC
jgi:hypothetical protein